MRPWESKGQCFFNPFHSLELSISSPFYNVHVVLITFSFKSLRVLFLSTKNPLVDMYINYFPPLYTSQCNVTSHLIFHLQLICFSHQMMSHLSYERDALLRDSEVSLV